MNNIKAKKKNKTDMKINMSTLSNDVNHCEVIVSSFTRYLVSLNFHFTTKPKNISFIENLTIKALKNDKK